MGEASGGRGAGAMGGGGVGHVDRGAAGRHRGREEGRARRNRIDGGDRVGVVDDDETIPIGTERTPERARLRHYAPSTSTMFVVDAAAPQLLDRLVLLGAPPRAGGVHVGELDDHEAATASRPRARSCSPPRTTKRPPWLATASVLRRRYSSSASASQASRTSAIT